jgi:ABC-2 type transport system permease protein
MFLKREYLTRVRTRSFVISTLALPLVLGVMVGLPTMMTGAAVARIRALTHRRERVVLVCADASLASRVLDQLEKSPRGTYSVEVRADTSEAARARIRHSLRAGRIDACLWLDPAAIESRRVELLTANPEDLGLRSAATSAVWWGIAEAQLSVRGVGRAEAAGMLKRVDLEVHGVGARHPLANTLRAIALVTVLTTVMIVTLLSYGVMVMRSVMEEKSSRITEILLCYASPEEMMAGKIAGVGAVGLTQIAIWGLIAAASVSSSPAMRTALAHGRVGPAVVCGFVVFYILGYALYSAIFAAVGAAFNSQDEAQQWNFIIVVPLIAGSLMVTPVVSAPSSAASAVMSMLPIWSPLLMYARMIVARPPVWQIALSVGLLIATIAVAIEACARIYRVGLLMYGKRPTAREILRWMRYA